MVDISDGFVILTDEVWDGSSLIIDQLSGNIYNVDGNASGSTTNVAETTTGTFHDSNNFGDLSDESDSFAQEAYSANAGTTLGATSDLLKFSIEVQSTVTLTDGTEITGVTLDVMVLENNQILFDFGDDDIAANFDGAAPIASIEVTGSSQTGYDFIVINAHDASYTPTCFTSGTLIETATGPTRIEHIKVGDMVLTLDNGYQPVRWIGSKHIPEHILKKDEKLRPVAFAPGSLGHGLPERWLRVSRQHRMLVSSKIAKRMFGREHVLIAAFRLLEQPGVSVETPSGDIEYLHLLFDRHEVVLADGIPSESLHLGQEAMRTLPTDACREIFEIFPTLANIKRETNSNYLVPEPKRQRKFVERHIANQKPIFSHMLVSIAVEAQ
ncbi:MAG: Hint domain-containing protein [Sulfitobacter sp.]